MYKVILHSPCEEKTEYRTEHLHYAKRYADLYRDEYPFVEIIQCKTDGDVIIETFGQKEKL